MKLGVTGVTDTGPLRRTDLRASVVDLHTCARALVFKGSRYSSFSDAISRLRSVNGCAHARDEHEHCDPPRDTPFWREAILRLAVEQRACNGRNGDPGAIARMLAASGVAEAVIGAEAAAVAAGATA